MEVAGCFGPIRYRTLLMGCGIFFCGVGVVEVLVVLILRQLPYFAVRMIQEVFDCVVGLDLRSIIAFRIGGALLVRYRYWYWYL